MNPLDHLTHYLGRIERRLRILAFTRGTALITAVALVFTVLLVLVANYFAFSDPSVLWSRIILFTALALTLGIGLVIPVLKLNRRRAARKAEDKFPQFEQRLLTLSERASGSADPFLQLLAADTLKVAETAEPDQVAERSWILSFASLSAAALLILLWLGTSGPGFLGYGTSLLWGGIPKNEFRPFYDIVVQPGDRTVRQRADQLVTARLVGFQAQQVRVLAKYDSSSKWEEAPMRPQPEGTGYGFLFAGVPESLQYYVEAGGVRSKSYKLNVVDLPGIKNIRVTYTFPEWTGLRPLVEDPGGDLRAVAGTVAEVAIQTDRPLLTGAILLDSGEKIALSSSPGNWQTARVPIQKDGLYHVAAVEQSETVRLSDDYFIEAHKDGAPMVRLTRPGRDAKVSPIEEVAVAVDGADDFGLHDLTLHYSVNGAAEKTVSLLGRKGQKEADGSTILYLEDFKLVPGDIVSLYATARDARASAKTNIFFIEAQPFEREYSQSQQAGGGGGGGGEDGNQISQRQKEIIAATWNQIKDTSGNKAEAAENAKFLSDVQSKLRDQARSLANRMRSRQLAGANQEFNSFVQDMEKAVEYMGPAADKLKSSQWQPALTPEQKALQYLLRAEATFRNIQVAFGNRGGGGGGGGQGRDLENLFDLELDTEKNQYESGQQAASPDQRQREIDEALQKLEQLARRQQQLNEQRKNQQSFQQRWQQEMLRREAEELQRKMEQLARNSQSGQMQQSGQQGQQSQQGQQGGRGQQGGQMGQAQLEQALERLAQATRDMRNAGSSQNNSNPQSEAEARRAAERLEEARNLLSGMRKQQAGEQLDELQRKAQQLAEQQQNFYNRMRQMYGTPGTPGAGQNGQQPGNTRQNAEQMSQEKQRMAANLQRLEQEMEKAARDLAGTQRSASSKLRDALATMQQKELGLRMRWSAEALRRGLGAYAVMREAPVTQGLNELSEQIRQAQSAVERSGQGGEQKDLQQALAQAERLRQQVEQLARGADQRGQRGQGQQQGQQGQQGQGQPGQGQPSGQPAQGGQGQQQGQGTRGGQHSGGQNYGAMHALNAGDWQPAPGGLNPAHNSPEAVERLYRETVRDLSRLQQNLESAPEISRDVQQLIQDMQRLEPRRFPGNPEMVERLRQQMLAGLEQLELQLRRAVDDTQGGSVRSGSGQPPPPGYAQAVAEYFRKLSKDK